MYYLLNQFLYELFSESIATIIGGLLLTLILFLVNEYILRKKNITGEWKMTIEIKDTTYNPYKNLKIEYIVHLLQKGNELMGSGEKIRDILPDGTQNKFLEKNRVRIDLDGFFERKYLRKANIYLQSNEDGRIRETRATYILTLLEDNLMKGSFISTAASTSGSIVMIKS